MKTAFRTLKAWFKELDGYHLEVCGPFLIIKKDYPASCYHTANLGDAGSIEIKTRKRAYLLRIIEPCEITYRKEKFPFLKEHLLLVLPNSTFNITRTTVNAQILKRA